MTVNNTFITTAELLGSAVRRFMMVCDIMDGKVEEPYFGSGFRCGIEELGRDYERCGEALESGGYTVAAGMDIYDIMKITGHTSPATLKKYIRANELEVVDKIVDKYSYFD